MAKTLNLIYLDKRGSNQTWEWTYYHLSGPTRQATSPRGFMANDGNLRGITVLSRLRSQSFLANTLYGVGAPLRACGSLCP